LFPHNNKELSDTTKCEAEIIPQNTRELSDSTKCEAEMISRNIRELSDPPNEKGEKFSVTNMTHSYPSLQHVQVIRTYVATLLQQWEDKIREQLWGPWDTSKNNACVHIDFFMGMKVLNEVKQKGALFLKQLEVCTCELLKQWRDEIREKLLRTSSTQLSMFSNIENIMRELTDLNIAYNYLAFSFSRYHLFLSLCHDVVDRKQLRTTSHQKRENNDVTIVMVDYKFANDMKVVMDDYKFVLHGNISWKELLSRTKQLKELPPVKTKLMCSIKSLHSY
jgi:hypothetical protein